MAMSWTSGLGSRWLDADEYECKFINVPLVSIVRCTWRKTAVQSVQAVHGPICAIYDSSIIDYPTYVHRLNNLWFNALLANCMHVTIIAIIAAATYS